MVNQVAIAGAGIGGLVTALNFCKRGWQVRVFEQAAQPGEIGAGIQISPNAMHVLAYLGVDEALESVACEPIQNTLKHYKTGRAYFQTPVRGRYLQRYGAKYMNVHRADLIEILHQAALQAGVVFDWGTSVTGYQQVDQAAQVSVVVENGAEHSVDLLVGADGIHSAVRAQMLKTVTEPEFTGQVAWRGTVPAHQLPSDLLPMHGHAWLGPKRHFVSYYLRGGELINFVAIEDRSQWTADDWNVKGDIQDVRTAFEGWDPVVQAILRSAQTCYLWGLFDHLPLCRWSDGRVVLLGDACHPMLPFMAQGGAMAMEDGYVLAEEVCASGGPIDRALNQYEQRRKPRTTLLQRRSRDNAKMFHESRAWGRAVRSLKFGLGKWVFPRVMAASLDSVYGVNVTAEKPSA